MTTRAFWLARARARVTCAMAFAACATVVTRPLPARADGGLRRGLHAHGRTLDGRLISRRDGPLTVALGATHGDDRARSLLSSALSDAVARNPALRFQPDGTRGASIVLSANVRSLTVQHDETGALARCDVGLVVADANGAVRAVLDARRTLRTDAPAPMATLRQDDDMLARAALRSAMDGALRRLVESGQWSAPTIL